MCLPSVTYVVVCTISCWLAIQWASLKLKHELHNLNEYLLMLLIMKLPHFIQVTKTSCPTLGSTFYRKLLFKIARFRKHILGDILLSSWCLIASH
jgi:hypothetical protein